MFQLKAKSNTSTVHVAERGSVVQHACQCAHNWQKMVVSQPPSVGDKWRKAVTLRAHVKVPFKSKCYSSRDSLIRTPLDNTQVLCSSNVYSYIDLMYLQLVLYFYVKIKKKHFSIAVKLKLRMNKYKINKILVYS